MPEPDFHRWRDDVAGIVSQPGFATVEQRARRIRTRQRAAAAAGALAVVVLLVSGGTAVLNLSGGPTPVGVGTSPGASGRDTRPGDPAPSPIPPWQDPDPAARYIQAAGASGPDHLYALVRDCPDCGQRLMASEDGGRTWQPRRTFAAGPRPNGTYPPSDMLLMTVVGPRTVVVRLPADDAATPSPVADERGAIWQLTVDGGRTWKNLARVDTAVPGAPDDGKIVDCLIGTEPGGACRLFAVLPATGQVAPLANQPPLLEYHLLPTWDGKAVWVQGYDPASHRPAVAVSRDGGRSWTTGIFDTEAQMPKIDAAKPAQLEQLSVVTADARTAYAVFFTHGTRSSRVYRSTDGGRTWARNGALPPGWDLVVQHRDTYKALYGHTGVSSISFVTGDGAHVLLGTRDGKAGYLGSRSGGAYTPVKPAGLPDPDGAQPEVVGDRAYLYQDGDRLYLSADGLRWRPASRP